MLDEFGLIQYVVAGRQQPQDMKRSGVVTGIGDDGAVVSWPSNRQLVMTCDTMTEQTHFLPETMEDEDIGFKAMASAISDIAAMGGVPRHALVSLTLPKAIQPAKVKAIYDGLYACANRYQVAVIGGDTTSSATTMTISITVTGEVEPNQALLRSAAQPGDLVFVTGSLGLSAAGLELLLQVGRSSAEASLPQETVAALIEAHRRPLPQVEAAALLAACGCHALNDVSDGIASEAWEIAEASGVGIKLIEKELPIDEHLSRYCQVYKKDPLAYALYGGEDYQLLGTLAPERLEQTRLAFKKAGIAFHTIGIVQEGPAAVEWIDRSGKQRLMHKNGYNHFK